jgi:hypothetical protein
LHHALALIGPPALLIHAPAAVLGGL